LHDCIWGKGEAKEGPRSLECIQALLAAGAQVDAADDEGWTPLHVAAHSGRSDAAACLLQAGANLKKTDSTGKTPMLCAARVGHEETVCLLVAAGADIEQQDGWGCTAPHYGADSGEMNVVRSLIDAGANINKRCEDIDGAPSMTALHMAANRGMKTS
jgi:ankyrin repeat protein